jgi:undecaprenyl-diphosphatase
VDLSTLYAVILGIVQGLAEFIPISSSGHLVLVPAIFGLPPGGLAFDVALHIGTTFAVIAFMRRELVAIARALLGLDRSPGALRYRRLGIYAALASIPVGIAGLTLEEFFEQIFATPTVAAVMLFVTGTLLLVGERLRDRRVQRATQQVTTGAPATGAASPPVAMHEEHVRAADDLPRGEDPSDPTGVDLDGMGLRNALLVGLAQCAALFPGISRSGTTIVAGMASGLTREAATRFSFLLSLPALVGATALSLPDLAAGDSVYGTDAIVAGVISSFVAGYFAIRWLLAVVSRDRLTGFAWYCYAAGTVSLIALQVA